MNSWAKFFACVGVAAGVYVVGFQELALFSEFFAFALIAVGCLLVLLIDRVNWRLLRAVFGGGRELLSVDEFRDRARAALQRNHPANLSDWFFEAEILADVPAGVIYAYPDRNASVHEKCCAFGECWRDSGNFVLSPLETLEHHLRANNCKSKKEVASLYLRAVDKRPLKLFVEPDKEKQENVEEVVSA